MKQKHEKQVYLTSRDAAGGMEEAEQSGYVAQLKAEFDSCDTASSGFLGPQEVTALCRKLHLDAQLPLVLDSLLGGGGAYARVDFEAFKDKFVDVLSRSLDLTSDDDSSYLQPVVADEVQPKFVMGEKRYGRRSRPDVTPSRPAPSTGGAARSSPARVRGPKVRRSTSLDSVESLKWDEEAARGKDAAWADAAWADANRADATWADFQPKASQHEEEESACDRLIGGQPCAQEHGELEQFTLAHFQNLLCGSAPICCSTPHRTPAPREDGSPLRASPGPKVLSRLDDGSGCASPERLVALWTDEGVRNARDILQTLDFSAEERVSLCELTLALDNELLVSGNAIHQVALICYKNEIQHLRARSERARGERDKAKADLERAELRNLQLLREADERLAGMEALNRTRIRELERDFRERLSAQRGQAEQECDAVAQQLEQERGELRRQLSVLEAREAELREELGGAAQETARLEEELADGKRRLSEAESGAQRLHADLKQLMQHKFGGFAGAALNPEDKLERLLDDCERRCRELRDQNDELSSELEILKRSCRKSAGAATATAAAVALSSSEAPSASESDSDEDEDDMKRRSSSPGRAANHPDDATAAVSIETEFALEKLKAKHKQEMQQIRIQMETQVNYYERSLDRMRRSMDVERKDIAQAFKLEISELEDQKAEAERRAKIAKEALDKLHNQLQHGGWWSEQERRMQRERADSEQNFAREIGNLVQRLSAEKDQLEAELKLKMDQEVMMVRRKLEEMEQQRERSKQEVDNLHREMAAYRQEVVSLSGRNAQLSADNADLSARLRERRDGREDRVRQLQEEEAELQREQRQRLEEELSGCKRKLSQAEAELSTAAAERQMMEAELRSEAVLGDHEAGHLQLSHAQEVSDLHRKLRDWHRKAEEAESNNRKLMKDSEEKDQHNQQLLEQVQQLLDDQQKMSTQVTHTRMARTQAEGQADAALALLRQEGAGLRERAEQLLAQLQEKQRRSLQMEEDLQLRARQNSAHINLKEEQHEKALAAAQQKTQEVEVKLKASRAVLHEKVQQLQQQMAKNVKSSVMLKELYVENSRLMKTLQLTERRLQNHHQDKMLLDEKVAALNRLLGDVVPAALHT
ncbi:ninein-like protein isoform X5 [Vanacampus margaritifer]